MTIRSLKELIRDLPDEMMVLVDFDEGFISACDSDSSVVCDDNGVEMLYIAPCCCDQEIEIPISSEDFPINEN